MHHLAWKVFVYVLVVTGLFLLADRFLGKVGQKLVVGSEFRFSRLYKGGMDNEILIIGNSRAVNAFFAP